MLHTVVALSKPVHSLTGSAVNALAMLQWSADLRLICTGSQFKGLNEARWRIYVLQQQRAHVSTISAVTEEFWLHTLGRIAHSSLREPTQAPGIACTTQSLQVDQCSMLGPAECSGNYDDLIRSQHVVRRFNGPRQSDAGERRARRRLTCFSDEQASLAMGV